MGLLQTNLHEGFFLGRKFWNRCLHHHLRRWWRRVNGWETCRKPLLRVLQKYVDVFGGERRREKRVNRVSCGRLLQRGTCQAQPSAGTRPCCLAVGTVHSLTDTQQPHALSSVFLQGNDLRQLYNWPAEYDCSRSVRSGIPSACRVHETACCKGLNVRLYFHSSICGKTLLLQSETRETNL